MNTPKFWQDVVKWAKWKNLGFRVLVFGFTISTITAICESQLHPSVAFRFVLLTISIFTLLPSLGFALCSFASHRSNRMLIWTLAAGIVILPVNRAAAEPEQKENTIAIAGACLVAAGTVYVIYRLICWWHDATEDTPEQKDKEKRDEKRMLGSVSEEPLESLKPCNCSGTSVPEVISEPSAFEFSFTQNGSVTTLGPAHMLNRQDLEESPLPPQSDSTLFSRNGITVMSGLGSQRLVTIQFSPNLTTWYPTHTFRVDDGRPVTIRDSFASKQAFYRLVEK